MDNKLFSRIITGYYVRCYELNPEMIGERGVRIYAECSRNTTGITDGFYSLELYVSTVELNDRDYILGTSFGEKQMSQKEIDEEIDDWVAFMVNEGSFPLDLRNYLKKTQIWEDFLDNEKAQETEEIE